MISDHEVEIPTGRRETDGHVRLYVFAGDMLALTVEELGERAPTLLLTREQAVRLRNALEELIPLLPESSAPAGNAGKTKWRGAERRSTGELK